MSKDNKATSKASTAKAVAAESSGAKQYRVIKSWNGVQVGDIIQPEGELHPSLAAHVVLDTGEGELHVASPEGGSSQEQ